MFRLTFLLCAGLFLAMLVGGQDRGQQRFGLAQQVVEQAQTVVVAAPAAQPTEMLETVAYVPEKPVMVQPAPVVEPAEAASGEGTVFFVTAESANVREGPGKAHAVIGRLTQGEAVLVVTAGEGPDGWSLIRIEGDGIEGYVASRLLTE